MRNLTKVTKTAPCLSATHMAKKIFRSRGVWNCSLCCWWPNNTLVIQLIFAIFWLPSLHVFVGVLSSQIPVWGGWNSITFQHSLSISFLVRHVLYRQSISLLSIHAGYRQKMKIQLIWNTVIFTLIIMFSNIKVYYITFIGFIEVEK